MSRIKCPDCNKDWGHSYCGTCGGTGFTIEKSSNFTEEDQQRNKAFAALQAENERLRQRLLTAAGDDLCRLSQEEIKAYTSGAVKIPPLDEFLPSCARFHAQVAGDAGVLGNCLTLAQLIAENEQYRVVLVCLVAAVKAYGDSLYYGTHQGGQKMVDAVTAAEKLLANPPSP